MISMPGVVPGRLHDHQPPARGEGLGQWGQHVLDLGLGRRAAAVRLRGEHEVVLERLRPAGGPRDQVVERERVVVAVEHHHRRRDVHRVAGLRRSTPSANPA